MAEDTGTVRRSELVEVIARRFHETYEGKAAEHGWLTQQSARGKPWEELPENNRRLMLAVVDALLGGDVIEPGAAVTAPFRGQSGSGAVR